MGVNPPPNPLFSREKLLALVANARQDFLRKDRIQANPPWLSDEDERIEMEINKSEPTPTDNNARCTTPINKQSHKRKLAEKSDSPDFSSSSHHVEESQEPSTSPHWSTRRPSYHRIRPGTDPMDYNYDSPPSSPDLNISHHPETYRNFGCCGRHEGARPEPASSIKFESSPPPSADIIYPTFPLSDSSLLSSHAHYSKCNPTSDSGNRMRNWEHIGPTTTSSKDADGSNSLWVDRNDTVSARVDFSSLSNDAQFSSNNTFIPDEDYDYSHVPILKHEPGRNDIMSGAVGLADTPLSDSDYQERNLVYCATAREAIRMMPLKVVTKQTLRDTFFPDSRNDKCWSALPSDFLIAIVGLGSAVEEVEEIERSGRIVTSASLMFALAKRGGTCYDDVVYPENIMPLIGFGEEGFDEEFWTAMWREADRWEVTRS